MVDSKDGVNQVQKQIEVLAERLFPERTRWMYYVGGGISGIISTLILLYFTIGVPLFNYVIIPFWNYVLLLLQIGILVLEIYLWRRNPPRFCQPTVRCRLLASAIAWAFGAYYSFMLGDFHGKVIGSMCLLVGFGWLVLWNLSCMESGMPQEKWTRG